MKLATIVGALVKMLMEPYGLFFLAGLSLGLSLCHIPAAKETGDWFMVALHGVSVPVLLVYAVFTEARRIVNIAFNAFTAGVASTGKFPTGE